MKPREECRHPKLNFGSGDYYIFCHECGAWWATVDPAGHEYKPAPQLANKGIGSQLSGEARVAAAGQDKPCRKASTLSVNG